MDHIARGSYAVFDCHGTLDLHIESTERGHPTWVPILMEMVLLAQAFPPTLMVMGLLMMSIPMITLKQAQVTAAPLYLFLIMTEEANQITLT